MIYGTSLFEKCVQNIAFPIETAINHCSRNNQSKTLKMDIAKGSNVMKRKIL